MPKCRIKSESKVYVENEEQEKVLLKRENGDQVFEYSVTFEADDGYTEEQVYQCSEKELEQATTHFNDSHLEQVAKSVLGKLEEPRVLTFKTSATAKEILKDLATEAGGLENNA